MPKVKLISELETIDIKYSDSVPHLSVFNDDINALCKTVLRRMQAATPSQLPHVVHAETGSPGLVIQVSFAGGPLLPAAELTLEDTPRIKLTDNVLQPASSYQERINVIAEMVFIFRKHGLYHLIITRLQ